MSPASSSSAPLAGPLESEKGTSPLSFQRCVRPRGRAPCRPRGRASRRGRERESAARPRPARGPGGRRWRVEGGGPVPAKPDSGQPRSFAGLSALRRGGHWFPALKPKPAVSSALSPRVQLRVWQRTGPGWVGSLNGVGQALRSVGAAGREESHCQHL